MEELDRKLFCSACGRKTNHNILFQQQKEVRSFTIIYTLVKCAGCDHVSYASVHLYDNVVREIIVYPEEPKVERNKFPKIWGIVRSNVPDNVKDLYNQIINSYNHEYNILCGLGLRTLIEAICLELKITKGYKYDINGKPLTQDGKKESLEGKIFGLFEKQYIIWYHTLILQRIREIGNAATHELIVPTSDELYSAINIIEMLIENIYELKNHELLSR
ncbi:DUF4145 domain-containing protein [Bacillus sp. 1NLA3E]|uniref:DUF4145 domain-containing protein n=1 Tax=Bacillus sp. 1NLA3E TaxID=666686 RepID=UPI000247EAF4|nr:DUF4145 domain-containing protein [Bacillus sp. 1NLA3E]AGK53171.1 hypothetical protein B1NLA3E_07035 [Bacillus sp. 1NLA3E]